MEKLFQIVELQEDEQILDGNSSPEPVMYSNYDFAFDAFNHRAMEMGLDEVKQPKVVKPLRVTSNRRALELWIITRFNTEC